MISSNAFAPMAVLRFRSYLLLLFCLGGVSVLGGCGSTLPACDDALGCIIIHPNEPIQVGYLLSLSGEAAVLGEETLRAMQLAVADRGGTLSGHEVVLIGADTACSQAAVATAFAEVAAHEQLIGIIGPSCSDEARMAIPLTTTAGIVMVSPSANAPDLLQTFSGAFFRVVMANDRQAAAAAAFAYHVLGARSAATVHDGSDYTIALTQQFTQTFTTLGGEIVIEERVIAGQSSVDEPVTALFNASPDVLFMPLFAPEANLVVTRMREIDSSATVSLIGADSLLTPEFPFNTGAAANGVYLTGTAVTSAAYEQFLTRWINVFGAEPTTPFHAHAYDATTLLLDALGQVAQSDSDGTLMIGRRALQQTISSANNYQALTGMLTCSNGECGAGEALGVFVITSTEIAGTNWPPAIIWTAGETEQTSNKRRTLHAATHPIQ